MEGATPKCKQPKVSLFFWESEVHIVLINYLFKQDINDYSTDNKHGSLFKDKTLFCIYGLKILENNALENFYIIDKLFLYI